MLLAHKVELRPSPVQADWLLKCIGARRSGSRGRCIP